MNILVVGCGKIGSRLAYILSEKNHDVCVIGRNQQEIDNLESEFEGIRFMGVPIDQELLKKAGIESCDVLCAVTNDDNTNIMVAQMAKEIYHVEKVITRILDSERAEIFSSFGLHSICPTNLTVDSICSAIEKIGDEQFLKFGPYIIKMTTIDTPKDFIGLKVLDIPYEENESLYSIITADGSFKMVDNYNITICEGDKLTFSKVIN